MKKTALKDTTMKLLKTRAEKNREAAGGGRNASHTREQTVRMAADFSSETTQPGDSAATNILGEKKSA